MIGDKRVEKYMPQVQKEIDSHLPYDQHNFERSQVRTAIYNACYGAVLRAILETEFEVKENAKRA